MTTATKINEVKFFLSYAFSSSFNTASNKEFDNMAQTIIGKVARNEESGLAGDIAKTIEKSKRVSDKQAYWIAKFAVENNLTSNIEFLFEA